MDTYLIYIAIVGATISILSAVISWYIKRRKFGASYPTGLGQSDRHAQDKTFVPYDTKSTVRLAWDSIDVDIVNQFVMCITNKGERQSELPDWRSILRRRGYIAQFEDDGCEMTVAGVLLFAHDPTFALPHARVQFTVYSGNSIVSSSIATEDLRLPVPKAINRIVVLAKQHLPHPDVVIQGIKRDVTCALPLSVIREALVNAFAHRDYQEKGSRITVSVFKDRLEIVSPGELPEPLTLNSLTSCQYRPVSRNPSLASGLFDLRLMEERGTGIRRMITEMESLGLPPPLFTQESGFFVVTLFIEQSSKKDVQQ